MTVHAFNFAMPFVLSRPVDIPGDNQGFMAVTLGVQRLSGEAIGAFELTLTNVVVGSRVHVEKQSDGTSYYDQVAAASTVVVSLSAYAPGSANNDLRVKVRKGSAAPYYKPYETLATASSGAQSIYVSQIPD